MDFRSVEAVRNPLEGPLNVRENPDVQEAVESTPTRLGSSMLECVARGKLMVVPGVNFGERSTKCIIVMLQKSVTGAHAFLNTSKA